MQKASDTHNPIQEKVLIVCGPTATGKTNLAAQLAKRFGGELINADSRQMYQGLDIISGKDFDGDSHPVLQKTVLLRGQSYPLVTYTVSGVPIWLYDVSPPARELSIAHFSELSRMVITDVAKRGKLPIIVGGSGYYLSSFSRGIDSLDIPPDEALRSVLSERSVDALQAKLKANDQPRLDSMNDSDRYNPRRLIRAIEVARWKKTHPVGKMNNSSYDAHWIGLSLEFGGLKEAILQRVTSRISRGAVGEARQTADVEPNKPSMTALGLPILKKHIAGLISLDEAVNLWTTAEMQYAKRQMTWFKRQEDIRWFQSRDPNFFDIVEKDVRQWYTQYYA